MTLPPLTYRDTLSREDRPVIEEIVRSTGYFNEEEVDVALELVDDFLARGPQSDYRFLTGLREARVAGYTCFGQIPATASSYDLYWIVVHKEMQGQHVGRALLERTEEAIRRLGGTRVYVETSGRAQYVSTRAFYEHNAYETAARLVDFYAPGDDKVIYLKVVG